MPTRSIRPFAISGAGRAPLLAVLAVVLALTACPVAQAAPWPLFGGSSGRASFAALESGSPPLSLAWSATAAADRGVWTTPIVTQGARPLVAYGSQRPWWIVGPTSTGNVHLRDARSPAAVIDTAAQRVTPDFQATSRMSPTLVTLADPTDQDRPTTYIAMGTSEPGSVHEVQTFRLRDLAPGPRSDDLSGWGLTVSVPVTVSGLPAGAPGSGVAVAPYLVAATGARATGRVYRLVRRSGRLAIDASTSVAGYPAPALALDAVVGPGAPSGGHVVLTTENNLYVLRASDLTQIARFSPTSLVKGCAPCSTPPPSSQTGFYTTTATIAGNYIYVERDDGTQLVLDIATAQPVAPASFTQAAGNSGSTFTRGQPAVAGGYVIFAGVNGVFAYKMNGTGGGGGGGEPPPASGATLVADTKANAGSPASSYGADTTLRAKSATYRSFMKFDVAGLPGAVTVATLRLKAVTQKSPDGGGVSLVANTLKDGATPWTESNLTWNTMRDLGARKIDSAGPVDPAVNGGVVTIALDPSAFAAGNGTYSLALDSASTTSAYLSSKEGTSPPQLLLSTSGTPPPAGSPPVSSFTVSPSSPTVDQAVTLTSTSTDPDNDITRYDWIIDGVAAGGPSVSTSSRPPARIASR